LLVLISMPTPSPIAPADRAGHADAGAEGASGGASWPAPATEAALINRNIGILCEDPGCRETLDLQQVVSGLGARTALVRPDLGDEVDAAAVEHTARVLSLLYDAVVCIDLPARSVERLRQSARIPVIADLSRADLAAYRGGPEAGARLRALVLARLGVFAA
jgi:hypothetical protein